MDHEPNLRFDATGSIWVTGSVKFRPRGAMVYQKPLTAGEVFVEAKGPLLHRSGGSR
jgi:hypothetical protein